MVIVAMPIFGALLYFMLGNKNTGKKLKKNWNILQLYFRS